MYDAVRTAVIQLIRSSEIRLASSVCVVYFVLYDAASEHQVREPAAAHHAALYADTSSAGPRRS
ncbi:hypothetical protein [Streptomyces sp. NPDC054783]